MRYTVYRISNLAGVVMRLPRAIKANCMYELNRYEVYSTQDYEFGRGSIAPSKNKANCITRIKNRASKTCYRTPNAMN